MSGAWLQFVASGLTAGAIYALVALGFSIIYNASGAINFAQGEFVMIGGMSAVMFLALGLTIAVALALAVVAAVLVALRPLDPEYARSVPDAGPTLGPGPRPGRGHPRRPRGGLGGADRDRRRGRRCRGEH